MRYAGIIFNDFSNAGAGVCLSFYTQGCPHRCEGCHNPETWDFEGGYEFSMEVLNQMIEGLAANGIQRNFCILGGEPLCDDNIFLTFMVLDHVRKVYPDIKIYLWTGYTLAEVKASNSPKMKEILKMIDVLIDGRYDKNQRDITLELRGSCNQHIYESKDFTIADMT